MTHTANRFAAAIAALFIVLATAIPVVTVPADTAAGAIAAAPILA